MRLDSEIQRDVERVLVNLTADAESAIVISVSQAIVTLTGFVAAHSQKVHAEAAAMTVGGVRGIANDLRVRLRDRPCEQDTEIAREAIEALKAALPAEIEADAIKVLVHDGDVSLEGSAKSFHDKELAGSAIRRLRGVSHVRNHIAVAAISPADCVRR